MSSGYGIQLVDISLPFYWQTAFKDTLHFWTVYGEATFEASPQANLMVPYEQAARLTAPVASRSWIVPNNQLIPETVVNSSMLMRFRRFPNHNTNYLGMGARLTFNPVLPAATVSGYTMTMVGDTVKLRKWVGGSALDVAQIALDFDLDTNPDPGVIVWAKFETFGDDATGSVTLRGKVWLDGEDEPSDWMISYVDDDYPFVNAGFQAIETSDNSIDDIGFWSLTSDDIAQTHRYAQPSDYLPKEWDAIPNIQAVNIDGNTVDLGASLGKRAKVTVTFRDHQHKFFDEPYDVGTYWGRIRARQGQAWRGFPLSVGNGMLGQDPDTQFEWRNFIIESIDGPTPDGKFSIMAQDPLKLLDGDQAQAPFLSSGSLGGDIDAAVTAAILVPAGIGDQEYASSGYLCLGGNEIVSFTRSGDNLTIARGQLGSTAQTHTTGDRVQTVLKYDGDLVHDILFDLLVNYGDVPAELIPFDDWDTEVNQYLPFLYARAITEPTDVSKLVNELIEQAALALGYDDLLGQIKLRVLRDVSSGATTIDEDLIVQGSLQVKDQPDQRISQYWAFFNQRNPTDRGDNSNNYRRLSADVDLERETLYNSPAIQKVYAAWLATDQGADRLVQIKLNRFRDPPRQFTFDLFQGTVIARLLEGYILKWRQGQDILGQQKTNGAPIQVTRVTSELGLLHVQAEEMLLGGTQIVTTNFVFLTDVGAGLWIVPDDWNDSSNAIHTIGGGGSGGQSGGGGGGGGAYSGIINAVLTPGSSINYSIGEAGDSGPGGDTWFGNVAFLSALVAAKGGQNGSIGSTTVGGNGGLGGAAVSGIGTTKSSGGRGGNGAPRGASRAGGGGGGGAGGPNGNGAQGYDIDGSNGNDAGSGGGGADGGSTPIGYDTSAGQNGGPNRFNSGGGIVGGAVDGQDGGGGAGSATTGGVSAGKGGLGSNWTQTVSPIIVGGPGGGGGGSGDPGGGNPGSGGLYGGGGGGNGNNAESAVGAIGGQGLIVISWSPA